MLEQCFNNIQQICQDCNVLGDNTFLTMSEWDVTNVTVYNSAFQSCKAMTNNNFMSSWNMSNCRELGTTFQGCTRLIELDLSNRFLTGLNSIRLLCADCTNLQTINLTNLIDKDNYSGSLTTNLYACEYPFNNCTSLQNNPYLQIGIGLASISFWSLTCVPDILDLSEIDTKIEDNNIVFYEIPYGIITENLMNEIGAAADQGKISGIKNIRNESNRKSG